MQLTNSQLKIILILCYLSTTLATFVSYSNPTAGYELSFYESTPSIVWISLIFSIIAGISITLQQVYTQQYKQNPVWFFSLLVLLLDRILLLNIPFIRGYYTWQGDNISHIGLIKDILFTGHIFSNNYYPVTHILVTTVIEISGFSVDFVVNHSTAFLSIYYVISIYLLSGVVLNSKTIQILSVCIVCCVFFDRYNIYLMPNGWSLFYLPIFFYFYFKSVSHEVNPQYKILFIISLVLYPFFHPLSSTLIILTLLLLGTRKLFISFLYRNSASSIYYSFPQARATFIEATIFFPWLLSFQCFHINIKKLYCAITTGGSPDVISQMSNTLDKVDIHGLGLMIFIIKMMGDELIFLSLSLISFIILIKSQERRNKEKLIELFLLTGFIFVIYFGYFFNILPGLSNIGSERLISYLVVFTPVLVGFGLNHFFLNKSTAKSIVCLLMVIASLLSIFSLYPSPYSKYPNTQITQMDIEGAEWLVNLKSPDINNVHIMSPMDRFADCILGSTKSESLLGPSYLDTNVPDHFNYTTVKNLGKSYTRDKYCMITMFDKTIYDSVWSNVGRFNKSDFVTLEKDMTVNKLYCNGECDIWYIHCI